MYSLTQLLSLLTTFLLFTTLTIASPMLSPQSLILARAPNTCTAEDAKSSCLLQNSVQKIADHCKKFCWPASAEDYDPVACGSCLSHQGDPMVAAEGTQQSCGAFKARCRIWGEL